MRKQEITNIWMKINNLPADATLNDAVKIGGFSSKIKLMEFMKNYSEYNYHNAEWFYEFCPKCEQIFKYQKTIQRRAEQVKGGKWMIRCNNCLKWNVDPPMALTPEGLREVLEDEIAKSMKHALDRLIQPDFSFKDDYKLGN